MQHRRTGTLILLFLSVATGSETAVVRQQETAPQEATFEDDPLVQRLTEEIEEATITATQSLAFLSQWLVDEVNVLVSGSATVNDSSLTEKRWTALSEASKALDPSGDNAESLSAARFILTRDGVSMASLVEGLASLMDLGEWESQAGGLAQQWRWQRDNPTGDQVRRLLQGPAGTARMRRISSSLDQAEKHIDLLHEHGTTLTEMRSLLSDTERSIQGALMEFPFTIDAEQAMCYLGIRVPNSDSDVSWRFGRLSELMSNTDIPPQFCFLVRSLDASVLDPSDRTLEDNLATVEVADPDHHSWDGLGPEIVEQVGRHASAAAVSRARATIYILEPREKERELLLTMIDFLHSVAGEGPSGPRLTDASAARDALNAVWQSWEISRAAAERLEGRIKALEALR